LSYHVVNRSRDRGGERLLNALLTEIERHEGIVFLATNRPHDLDEAMHRRITCVVQFSSPDYNMRLRIWESLLNIKSDVTGVESANAPAPNGDSAPQAAVAAKSTRLAATSDVDLPALAIKYELTGGFIKNALLSALLSALHRRKYDEKGDCSEGVVLTQGDLEEGCKLQMRGSLSLRHLDMQVKPSHNYFLAICNVIIY
jgi:SpoVK/Ycf46/Vps4 family AAA+-type ATPase